jgi:hypothetical protein
VGLGIKNLDKIQQAIVISLKDISQNATIMPQTVAITRPIAAITHRNMQKLRNYAQA